MPAAPALGDLPQLLVPRFNGEYTDLLFCLYLGIVLLVFRIALESALTPRIATALAAADAATPAAQRSSFPAAKRSRKVFDNAFTSLSSGLMTAWAWSVLLQHNGGCTPVHTSPCLIGWPHHPLSDQFRYLWLTMMGFYTYEMIGTAIRQGCILGPDMVVHHILTMIMMLYGYYGGLNRYGLMATAMFDSSNPVLHAAKTFNYMDTPAAQPLKDITFKLFALVFALVRVTIPPFSLIYPGLLDGRVLPRNTYFIANGLMLSVFAMQLFWFAKIVNIALGGGEAAPASPQKRQHVTKKAA